MRGFLGAAILLGMMFSGCMSDSDSTVQIPFPSIGDRYHYVGDEGSDLVVTFSESKDVTIIDYQLNHPRVPLELRFSETLREDLLLSEQKAHCRGLTRFGEDPPHCIDELSLYVHGAEGLSAGFFMSDLWGLQLPQAGTFRRDIENPVLGAVPITYHTEPQERSCVRLTDDFGEERARMARMLFFSWGPVRVICDGQPMPQSFVTMSAGMFLGERPIEFTLVGSESGSGETLGRPRADILEPSGPGIDGSTESSCPYYLPDATDPYPFTAREAHHGAMEVSETYRKLFTSECGTQIFSSGYGTGPSSYHPILGLETGSHRRWIMVVDQTGVTWEFMVQKNITRAHGIENISYGMMETEKADERPEWVASFKPNLQQLTIREAYDDMVGSTELRAPAGSSGYSHQIGLHSWMGHGDWYYRTDGYEVRLEWRPPANRDSIFFVAFSVHDGPTGSRIFWHA